FRSSKSLDDYLRENNVIGIEGVDTRALVRRIRVHGAMTGVLSTEDLDDASLIAKAQSSPDLVGQDLVQEVIPHEAADWDQPAHEYLSIPRHPEPVPACRMLRVALTWWRSTMA